MASVQYDTATRLYPGTSKPAVNDLNLEVPEGTIYGFIGPNGSGKTTTLRMIMRILHPDQGTIRVLGEESLDSANDRVGYLPEERSLYKQMKVRDVLRFCGALKGAYNCRQDIESWLERLGLANLRQLDAHEQLGPSDGALVGQANAAATDHHSPAAARIASPGDRLCR